MQKEQKKTAIQLTVQSTCITSEHMNCLKAHSGRVVTLSPPTSEAGVRFPTSSGKAGSCLPLVGRTLTNCMYRMFPLPFQLPVVIWPVQC